MSSYEEKIVYLLKKAKLNFRREKSYKDLKNGKYRFDFEVTINGKKVLIEVNGMQHYCQVQRFQKTRSALMSQKERDRRKISYCLSHGIKLYIIPFWEVERLRRASEIFSDKYLAKDMWKNDKDWLYHQNLTKS